MADLFRHSASQAYLSIIPAGIVGWLLYHGYRSNPDISQYYTWRSKTSVPNNIVDALDAEFTDAAANKSKKMRTGKFQISLVDNLEARTYGSFYLNPGAEFQIPVVSTIDTVKELKERYPNLVDLVQELGLKGLVDTDTIPEEKLQRILLSESARYFFLRREITQAESFSHIVIPGLIGSVSFVLGFPVFKILQVGVGPWAAVVITACFAAYFTYRLLMAEKKQRVLAMDKRVLEGDSKLLDGAKQYFISRLALGRLFYQYGDAGAKLGFTEKGDCASQEAPYTQRLAQLLEMEVKANAPSKGNVRAL